MPLGDRVLVLPDDKGEERRSGIIVPGSDDNLSGVVVQVGPGKTTDTGEIVRVGVTWGDHVLIGRYGHEEVMFDGKKYYIVPESSLLAVIV